MTEIGTIYFCEWLSRYLIYIGYNTIMEQHKFEDFGDRIFYLTEEQVGRLKRYKEAQDG